MDSDIDDTTDHPLIDNTHKDHTDPEAATNSTSIIIASAAITTPDPLSTNIQVHADRAADKRTCGNPKKDSCAGGICMLVVTAICLTIGLCLYFAVYKVSTYDSRYRKGECFISNNTIDSMCYTNYCDYVGNYRIVYNGLVKRLEASFTVDLKTRDYNIAELRMKKYDVGTVLTCYYPDKDNIPLKIDTPRVEGNFTAYYWACVLFVGTVIVFCCGIVHLCMAYDETTI